MSTQAVTFTGSQPSDNSEHGGFRCFCGEWFPNRVLFDEHFKQHPDKFIVCNCCKRVLPKGSWEVDAEGNFVSVD